MRNQGKIFEEQLQKSVPEYALLYRLHDSAQSFGGSTKLRFSSKNPFDFLMWDSKRHILYALEMKTVKGKSITFERTENDHYEIHLHQINGLNKWNAYDGIECGFIIEFRGIEKTCYINIEDFNALIKEIPKKRFGIDDLDKYGIPYFIIPQKKLISRYRYDIESFLNSADKLNKE